jgi:hypothetical protein
MLKVKPVDDKFSRPVMTSTIANSDTLAKSPSSLNGILMSPRMDEWLRVELMTIPPDLAVKWLKRNRINRPLQRRHVLRYVEAIKAGEWDDANGETIIFSDENDLMDGQHRLTAVVEAQKAIVSLVVFGVSTKKRGSIDTGAKRLMSNFLGMDGVKNATAVASIMAMLHAYEDGVLLQYPAGKPFASYDEGRAFLEKHPGIHEAAHVAKRIGTLMRTSIAGMVYYAFAQRDVALANIWSGTMIDGRVRMPHEVFLTLRERLLKQRRERDKLHYLEQATYCVKAFNAARQGKTIKIFKWLDDEPFPEIL